MADRPRALRRVLGLRDLAIVAAAAMGPAFSLQTTLGAMIGAAGSRTLLALTGTTLVMALVAIGYRALGRADPDAGSSYAWIRAAFGPVAGVYGAWVLVAGNLLAIVATALPAGTGLLDLVAPASAHAAPAVALVASAFTLGSAWLLWRGIAPTTRVALALLGAELVLLAAAAAWAWRHPQPHALAFAGTPGSLAAVAAAMTVGIWMLDGWEVSASTAEDAHDGRAAGDGGLLGLALSGALLLACTAAFARVGDAAGFAQRSDDALSYVAERLGGGPWTLAVGLTVLVSLTASLQTTLVYLTRSLYAMGRDGTLPARFGRLDGRAEPRVAIVAMAALGTALALGTAFSPTAKAAFDAALAGTAWFIGLLFVLTALAAVRRFAGDPARRWDGVVAPAAGALALLGVLAGSLAAANGPTRAFIGIVAAAGVPLAWWRGRSHAVRVGTSRVELAEDAATDAASLRSARPTTPRRRPP